MASIRETLSLDNNKKVFLLFFSLILVITPYIWLRFLGWAILFYLIRDDLLLGLGLLSLFSFFFDDKWGTFKLFFTLKPFQIIFLFLIFSIFLNSKKRASLKVALSKEDILILLFLFFAFLSSFRGNQTLRSIFQCINLLFGIGAFLLIERFLRDRASLSLIINFFILGGIIKAFTFFGPFLRRQELLLFNMHSSIASPLSFLIFILSAKYFQERKIFKSIGWLLFFSLGVLLILYSGTRGFIIFGFFALLFFLVLGVILLRKIKKSLILFFVCLLCFFFSYQSNPIFRDSFKGVVINLKKEYFKQAILLILKETKKATTPLVKKKPTSLPKEEAITKELTSPPIEIRENHPFKAYQGKSWTENPILSALSKKRYQDWLISLRTIKENPFLGRGLRDRWIGSHSLYLELFAAIGLFGFIGFFSFIFSLLVKNFFLILRKKEALSLGFLSSLFVWLGSSLTSTYYVQHYIWVFLGIGIGLINSYKESPLLNKDG